MFLSTIIAKRLLVLQKLSVGDADCKRLQSWQRDCADVLDEPATSSQAADNADQQAAVTSSQQPGYLFEGQLSQVLVPFVPFDDTCVSLMKKQNMACQCAPGM